MKVCRLHQTSNKEADCENKETAEEKDDPTKKIFRPQVVPITYEVTIEDKNQRIIQHGQHNDVDHLIGFGRILIVKTNGEQILLEGQFESNKLDGFGRIVQVFRDGSYSQQIGFY